VNISVGFIALSIGYLKKNKPIITKKIGINMNRLAIKLFSLFTFFILTPILSL
jgi:hypothetical protein